MTALDTFTDQADAYMRICGARVRAGRLSQNMTQADLARACYAPNANVVTHWELGRAMPAVARQFAIANALVLPMTVLWGHTSTADMALDVLLANRAGPGPSATSQAGIQVRGQAISSHYVSTACIHDQHGANCPRVCMVCDAPCRCWCHVPLSTTEPSVETPDAFDRARHRAGEALDP